MGTTVLQSFEINGKTIPEIQPYVQMIKRNVALAVSLVGEYLDQEKIASGEMPLHFFSQNICELIQKIVDSFRPLSKQQKNIEIDFSPLPVDKALMLDTMRIQQVMINLITNAVKFAPDNSTVSVKIKLVDSDVLVSVHDEGHGVPKEDLSKIFDRFYRGKGNAEGFGLGLYIAKWAISVHGGRLWVESAIGEGATFFFTLPCGDRNEQN